MELLFKNEKVNVFYNNEVGLRQIISFGELMGVGSGYRGFTQNIRGIKKAVEAMRDLNQIKYKEEVGFWEISTMLDNFKLKTHTYLPD